MADYATIDKPSDYFDTKVYTGTGSNNITLPMDDVGLVWMKNRTNSGNNILMDIIRGGNNANSQKTIILSNTTGAEQGSDVTATGGVAFGSTSTVIGSDNGGYNYNNSTSSSYCAWHWRTGTAFSNDASSTSIGTIDSAGSVNTDAGFSIISFTKTDGEVTVAHGLGAKPSLIIFKPLASANWIVTATINNSMSNNYLLLHASDANQTDGAYANPTSSVFSISNNIAPNSAHIAYCFAPKQGYSKFGSYTGNGNVDGTFVYTGFKPAFVMVKITSEASNWDISTGVISANQINERLRANLSNAEESSGYIDFLSNGFKMRNTNTSQNKSGSTYIYMAFAKNPFVTSSGVPATAR